MSLIVLGIATEYNTYVKNWEKSLKKSNITYKLLGLNCNWNKIDQLLSRQLLGYKYIIENNIKDDTIICHTDVYDCIFLCESESSLINLIKEDKIYVSAEFYESGGLGVPLSDYYKHNSKDDFNPYICGGFVIGTAKNMKHWYNFAITHRYSMYVMNNVVINGILQNNMLLDLTKKKICKRNQKNTWIEYNKQPLFDTTKCENNDQPLLCLYANYFPNKVIIDIKEKLCITAHFKYQDDKNLLSYDSQKHMYINKYNNYPCVIHIPYLLCKHKKHNVKLTRLEFYNSILQKLKI